MTIESLAPAIEALRTEESTVAGTVSELEGRLGVERERLERVRAALASLLRLTELAGDSDTLVPSPVPALVQVQDSERRDEPTRAPRARGRIPTPSIVTDIINERGGIVTREDVISETVRRVGERVSEWADPRNVITVALNRASDRGQIVKIDRDHYRPAEPEPDAGAVDGD